MDNTRSASQPLQPDEPRNWLQPHWSNFVVIVTITFTTIVGTVIWVLDILNVLYIAWAGAIGAILSAIGVLLALWPLDSLKAVLGRKQVIDSLSLPDVSPKKIAPCARKRKGILHVKVRKQLRHTTIALYRGFNQAHRHPDAAATISERRVVDELVYIATFPSVEPGNYTVATQDKEHIAFVTIYAGVTSWIDWR